MWQDCLLVGLVQTTGQLGQHLNTKKQSNIKTLLQHQSMLTFSRLSVSYNVELSFRCGKNKRSLIFLPTFALMGGNYITLTASISDTFGNPPNPVECSFVCFGICNTCVKLMKVVCLKMAARRVNMCYSTREDVELVLNEGLDLEDFSDSVSEENIVDSGEEFVPVNFEADSSNSDNNIFIFITGICATSRIKLLFFYCVWTVPALLLRQRKVCDMTLWIIYLTSTHPKLSKNVCLLYYSS